MIYPKHHKLYKLFFDFYTKCIISSDFKDFRIIGEMPDIAQKPLLVVANHYSWWDGFFHYQLNNTFFKKHYHVMMLEEQLSKRMFLTRLGVFGVKKGTRDAAKSLRFSLELLKDKQNMLLIFPQGKIESQHTHIFKFESGIRRIVESTDHLQVVFVVTLIDYFSERKPIVNNYLKILDAPLKDTDIEQQYNDFFAESLAKQNKLV